MEKILARIVLFFLAASAVSGLYAQASGGSSPTRTNPHKQHTDDVVLSETAVVAPLQLYLTLDSCLNMALSNSASLRNAHLDYLAAKAQKQELLGKYFPQVSAMAFAFGAFDPLLELGILDIIGNTVYTRELERALKQMGSEYGFNTRYKGLEHGLTASVTAVQPVFAGGRIVNGNRLARLGMEASSLQERIKRREILEEAEKNYWLVVSLNEKLKTLDQLETLLGNIEKDVQSAVAAGLATETDAMRVSLSQNELKSGRIQVENGIRLAKMNLFNTVGLEYNPYRNVELENLPRLDDVFLADSLSRLLPPENYYKDEEEIAAMQEELRLLDIQVRAGELQKKLVMGEALPQIGIGANYGYSDLIGDGRFNGAVFATVKVPLSDWGSTARKMQGESFKLQKAKNDRDFYGRQLVLQIRQLWLNLTASWEQLQVAEASVRIAEHTTGQLQEHYRAGMVSLSELLQAQSELRQACDTYTDRKIDYQTALQSYLRRICESE